HLEQTSDIAGTVTDALAAAGPGARLCVLPEGPQTIPYVETRLRGGHQRLDRGDDPVRVVQAEGELAHPRRAQAKQRVDAGGDVDGRIDGQLDQAFGRAVHQPPAAPAVHAGGAAHLSLRPLDGADRTA